MAYSYLGGAWGHAPTEKFQNITQINLVLAVKLAGKSVPPPHKKFLPTHNQWLEKFTEMFIRL